MINTTELVRNITDLPVLQRLTIIENLLKSVKDDTFKQIENKEISDIKVFYQIFLLNNETFALHSFINQISTNELPITKGDKKLNPTALFGIWENKPRNIQEIRQQDWKRNWDL
jgi:hypothetical protein